MRHRLMAVLLAGTATVAVEEERERMDDKAELIPADGIEQCIFLIRGQKVMLDFHLAALYGVETKNLNKAVKRNLDRFPSDFMFLLTAEELANLKFQIGTSSSTHGGRRKPVSAFTEQ
jgi:hypothetical protein